MSRSREVNPDSEGTGSPDEQVDDSITEPAGKLLPGAAYEGETDEQKQARQAAIRDAYSKAQTKIREDHLDEFNGLVRKYAEEYGYDWKPKPTAAEKRRAQIKALLDEDPSLREEFLSDTARDAG